MDEAVYLGDIIRADGKNTSNIQNRVNKGIGQITKIMDMLKSVSFGEKYFQIANTLREATFLSGMLTNADVWYNLHKNEIEQLEQIDRMLLRAVLEVPDSTCVESLYLELGLIPIHIIIKARRVNYLHYLAKMEQKI